MKRIIFVDDEENILNGLKRMLRSIRRDWDITLVNNAQGALDIMAEAPAFDLVISDIRMPGMDGIEFLKRVKEQHPLTVRFALSGQADHDTLFKAANITHQFIKKPCDPQNLHNLIARALSLRERLSSEGLKKTLLEAGALPSVPALYQDILSEIQSEDPSIARIGKIIAQDIAMSTKVLQIVNSAFMGLRHQVTDPVHAATLLGLENLKSIALMIAVFSTAENKRLPRSFSLEALWSHCLSVSDFAKRIAENETEERSAIDNSFTSGLLHDIGQIVLATSLSEKFAQALALSEEKKITLFEAEKEIFQATHADVGGFLLELWGLPDPIVEAITFHYHPSALPEERIEVAIGDDAGASLGGGLGGSSLGGGVDTSLDDSSDTVSEGTFSALAAVHVANYFCGELEFADAEYARPDVDMVFLERFGLAERIDVWWDFCHPPAE